MFFGLQALWSSQNVFGPPSAATTLLDFKDREALFSCISYLSPGLSSPQLLLGDLIDRTGQGKNSVIRTSTLPKLCSTLVDWPLQQQFLHFLTQHIQSGEHAMGEQEPEG